MVLDTDTANEIDDQFALVYAALSESQVALDAVYAAPFTGRGADHPGEGMQRSHDEILRVLDHLDPPRRPAVLTGSRRWLADTVTPVESEAAADLVQRGLAAREEGATLCVVAIGAPTNVASALLLEPALRDALTVVWLGGDPTTWHTAAEFNLEQDLHASRVLLDCGVDLVHVPCVNVTQHLRTTRAEVDRHVRPHGAVGAYLAALFDDAVPDEPGASWVLWDVGAVAWAVDPRWTPTVRVHSPVLTDQLTWSHDPRRHLIREMLTVDRDAILGDLFAKLAAHAATRSRQ